jgi:hypothetical protein
MRPSVVAIAALFAATVRADTSTSALPPRTVSSCVQILERMHDRLTAEYPDFRGAEYQDDSHLGDIKFVDCADEVYEVMIGERVESTVARRWLEKPIDGLHEIGIRAQRRGAVTNADITLRSYYRPKLPARGANVLKRIRNAVDICIDGTSWNGLLFAKRPPAKERLVACAERLRLARSDLAISFFAGTIGGSDLKPNKRASAYIFRGNSYYAGSVMVDANAHASEWQESKDRITLTRSADGLTAEIMLKPFERGRDANAAIDEFRKAIDECLAQ